MWDLWWTKWHWNRYFVCVLRFSPVSTIPPVLLTHLRVALTRANRRSRESFPKAMCFWKSGSIRWKISFTFFLSFRVLKESEDHCCAVYTTTYASEAMRLYGGCVRNFYTPLRWITNTTLVPLHPLVVSPLCARSGLAGWIRGPVWTWWRRVKSFTLPAIEHMLPPLDTPTWPPRAG